MATTAVWEAAVQAIECLLTDRANAAAVYSSGLDTERLLKAHPAPAVWRKLLDDVQVPLRVGKVLSQAAAGDPARNLVVTAVCILSRFFECAPGGAAATTPAQKQAAWRQLQQSGAVQAMPRVITAASVTLGGCFTAAVSGNLAGALSSCGSIGALGMAATSMRDPFWLPDHVERALTLVESWKHLQPEGAAAAAVAPCLAAALQLANTAMRLVSTHVQQHLQSQQSQQQLQPPALEPVIPCLDIVNHVWALEQEFLTWQEEEAAAVPAAVRQMLQSQSYFTGKALLAVVSTFAGLLSLKEQAAATDAGTPTTNSTSTSTSNRTANSTGSPDSTTPTNSCCEGACNGSCIRSAMAAAVKHSTKSWEQSAALLPLLTPCHTKLLELLGVDGRSVAWAAAHVGSTYTLFNAKSSTRSILSGLFSTLHTFSQTFSAAASLRTMPQAQARVVLQLLPLLAATATHAAAWVQQQQQQQQQLSVQLTLDMCTSAAQTTTSLMNLYEKCRRQQQLEQQSTFASAAHALLPLLPVEWLQQMLPRTLQLANKVLQCLYPASDSSAAAATTRDVDAMVPAPAAAVDVSSRPQVPPSSSSSSSSRRGEASTSTSAGTRSSAATPQAGATESLGQLLFNLQFILSAAGILNIHEGLDEQQQQQPQQEQQEEGSSETSGAWCYFEQHAADVAAVLEGYVRTTAAQGTQPDAKQQAILWLAWLLRGAVWSAAFNAGPDSAVWQQLVSLLRSFCKQAAVCGNIVGPSGSFHCCHLSCSSSVPLLQGPATTAATDAGEGAAAAAAATATYAGERAVPAAAPAEGVMSSSTSSATTSSASSSQADNALVEAQPLVFIAGCFCLLVVQLHKQQRQAGVQHVTTLQSWDTLNLFRLDAKDVLVWLQSSAVTAALTAAGYQPQQLANMIHCAEELLAAVTPAVDSEPHGGDNDAEVMLTFDTANESRILSGLEAAGTALTSLLATPAFCNNPACGNVDGPSDALLVSGASCVCGGCLVARYCSRACQRAHWKQHKPVCKALQEAKAAKAAAPAPAAVGGVGGGSGVGGDVE